MKKHHLKEALVVPRAIVPHVNGEAATAGCALEALNVREREQSLQVTGVPAVAGAIAVGERLLLVAAGHRVTCRGNTVSIDNVPVTTASAAIVGAHAIGDLIVVVTAGGLIYLSPSQGGWVTLDPAAAVPQLTFSTPLTSAHADIEAYTFAEAYSQWRAPLASADCSALARLLRAAWNNLAADAAAEGLHTAPMLVRWAVRLTDDSYLWMSEPVRVGDATLANADRITAVVDSSNNGFTGIQSSTLTMLRYRLEIGVTQGIAAEWLPQVKSIDVLVTDEARLLNAGNMLDYRCLTHTVGQREHVLEMGLSRRTDDAIAMELAASPWHLVATAPASATLSGSDFAAALEALTMTVSQCAEVGAMTRVTGLVCSTSAAGRLYCCTSGGDVIVSEPGNALVQAHKRSVVGTMPMALAVVTKPLYSGGFGRYPVYVFTDDGVFAIPQSATGSLGEARLVDRTVIAADVPPAEGGGDVWFVSRHRHLCRLNGARVTVCDHDVDCNALAWCNTFNELWLLPATGYPVVRMASGALSRRSVDAAQLYSDPRHAIAVADDGTLLDLEQETVATVPVEWRSHPVAIHRLMGSPVRRLVWHVKSTAADLTLRVTGQRGIMADEREVSRMVVSGVIDHPLATPVMAVPARTIRMSVAGTAATGTLLLPVVLYY